MKKIVFFCIYHPESLFYYRLYIDQKIDKKTTQPIFLWCKHPYTLDSDIKCYSAQYEEGIFFNDITYSKNLIKGILSGVLFIQKLNRFLNQFKGATDVHIISDLSAFLPMNIFLSTLKKQFPSATLSSGQSLGFEYDTILVGLTCLTRVYTKLFSLSDVVMDSVFYFVYKTRPRYQLIRFRSAKKAKKKSDLVLPFFHRQEGQSKVVIFGSLNYDYKFYRGTKKEFESRLAMCMAQLRNKFSGKELLFKPHPKEVEDYTDMMDALGICSYESSMLTQLFLLKEGAHIHSCFSIVSSSLILAVKMGIPSYTLFDVITSYQSDFISTLYSEIKNDLLFKRVSNLDQDLVL